MMGMVRRSIVMTLLAVLMGAAVAAAPAPARADGAFPLDSGRLTVCIQRNWGWDNWTCDLYSGSVNLGPNPGLISNTLTSYERDLFFGLLSLRLAGKVEAVGAGGGTATLTIDVSSAFGFLPFWLGNITFTDPGAGVAVTLGVWFSPTTTICWDPPCSARFSVAGHTGVPFFGRLLPGTIAGWVQIT